MEVTIVSSKVLVFNPIGAEETSYMKLLGYNKIQEGILQQRLSKHYSFESLHGIFKGHNVFRNKLQEEISKLGDPYPWLEPIIPKRRRNP